METATTNLQLWQLVTLFWDRFTWPSRYCLILTNFNLIIDLKGKCDLVLRVKIVLLQINFVPDPRNLVPLVLMILCLITLSQLCLSPQLLVFALKVISFNILLSFRWYMGIRSFLFCHKINLRLSICDDLSYLMALKFFWHYFFSNINI